MPTLVFEDKLVDITKGTNHRVWNAVEDLTATFTTTGCGHGVFLTGLVILVTSKLLVTLVRLRSVNINGEQTTAQFASNSTKAIAVLREIGTNCDFTFKGVIRPSFDVSGFAFGGSDAPPLGKDPIFVEVKRFAIQIYAVSVERTHVNS